jgi:hypothetical protein
MSDQIPPFLKLIIDEARRPRFAKEDEAARRFVLGQSTLGQFVTELHNAKQDASSN